MFEQLRRRLRLTDSIIKSNVYFLVGLIVVILPLDQITKAWARSELKYEPIFFGDSQIGFSLIHNSGSAFSLYDESTLVLTILSIAIVALLCILALRSPQKNLALSYSLIVAGALGNIADRLFQPPSLARGHVTDFIKVGDFPTFNIADSFVTIGAVLLVVSAFVKRNEANPNG